MDRYFQYYFYNRARDMSYPVDVGRDDSLLELLSNNGFSVGEYCRVNGKQPDIYFRQSFKAAADAFKAIEAPNQGVIVPFGEGEKIIAELFSQSAIEKQFELLRKAQRFTVNAFANEIEKLLRQGALIKVKDIEILVLNKEYYHKDFGLSTTKVNDMELLNH
jgi:CRISPR-associated endonuclease/helicase Cas3